MESSLKASVVICTYNRKEWLLKCYDSLQKLDDEPSEIIIVDGPSNDGTRQLIEEWQRHGKVRLVAQKKLEGISAARNLGLSTARGDVVCFIDDDVIVAPGWLDGILSGYKDDKVGGVGGPTYFLDGSLAMGRNKMSVYGDWYDESRGEDTTGLYPVMLGCNMSFRTEALRSVGGFDPYFRYHRDEDDACIRVDLAGYTIGFEETAALRHAWCEGSYRRDRFRWYFRLRYLWGRNHAHLVRKNFKGRVTLQTYVRNRLPWSTRERPRRVMTETRTGSLEVPRPLRIMGSMLEMLGHAVGWYG
ncbi:MAG: glycosyltransferase [Methanomassiliicoccales archaeon]|nr:glycosyltransferase [Methanomassiliicoccales archaeon]